MVKKILLDVKSSGIQMTGAFLLERMYSENVYEIICNIFSGRLDIHLQAIQPILKVPYLISPHEVPQVRHLK